MSQISNDNHDIDTEEFLRLLRLNQKRIFAFILGLIHNHANAEDVMQETITTMWRKYGRFEESTDFSAWAITIAKYTCYNYRRKVQPKGHQLSDKVLDFLYDDYETSIGGIDSTVDILRECVRKLHGNDKDLIYQRFEKDLKVSKIAEFSNETVQNIYRKLAKVYMTLVKCIHRSRDQEELA